MNSNIVVLIEQNTSDRADGVSAHLAYGSPSGTTPLLPCGVGRMACLPGDSASDPVLSVSKAGPIRDPALGQYLLTKDLSTRQDDRRDLVNRAVQRVRARRLAAQR